MWLWWTEKASARLTWRSSARTAGEDEKSLPSEQKCWFTSSRKPMVAVSVSDAANKVLLGQLLDPVPGRPDMGYVRFCRSDIPNCTAQSFPLAQLRRFDFLSWMHEHAGKIQHYKVTAQDIDSYLGMSLSDPILSRFIIDGQCIWAEG